MYELPTYTKIWRIVQLIPFGKVASYGQISDLAGLPGRARLVGKSLSCVPEGMSLPWYKVLRSNGQIAFPVGSAQSQKQIGLLEQEDIFVFNNRINLKIFLWHPDLHELLWKLEY
ncbi:MAG: methylated-DNA-protein-cysteine methyltransferase-like protein [Paraglaciecola sp.]|jgi:methylated-DNA-protein-cysteine methyltransferase-like protein|uniref:MGMT family protein n=1 Tax=uncultured Paraglaciecola sp. TaxID=1765024 RepID=UPI0025EDDA36|nr:MGMT family protein [uncultured Paraglaciecola sp.]